MKKLEQPVIGVELTERRNGGMAEARIGAGDGVTQLIGGHETLDERADHGRGHLAVGTPAKTSSAPPPRGSASIREHTARHPGRGRKA